VIDFFPLKGGQFKKIKKNEKNMVKNIQKNTGYKGRIAKGKKQ
jgi:hypothetical protein